MTGSAGCWLSPRLQSHPFPSLPWDAGTRILQTAFPSPPFWPASCQEERDIRPALVSAALAAPETQLLPVLQRPPALPLSVCHRWRALPQRGSAPSWLGRPWSWVQATPVLPWGPRGPSVVPLSCRYVVLLAPTPVWAAPRVRAPLLDADWKHCMCDSTLHSGARSVHRAPRQVLGAQYHPDELSSALRAAASQPGWWCAESEVQAC